MGDGILSLFTTYIVVSNDVLVEQEVEEEGLLFPFGIKRSLSQGVGVALFLAPDSLLVMRMTYCVVEIGRQICCQSLCFSGKP